MDFFVALGIHLSLTAYLYATGRLDNFKRFIKI